MKKRIELFDKFPINEALGVAQPTTFYVRRLTYIVVEEFYKFIDETRPLGRDAEEDLEYEVVIPYNQLINMIPTGGDSLTQYSKFPVSEIVLDLNFYKKNTEYMKGNDYMVGGYAMPFAKGRELKATRFKDAVKQLVNHSLSVCLGITFYYGPYFRKINTHHPQFESTKMFKKIESVLTHELNHLYEFYNRKLNKAPSIQLAPTMASLVENTYDVPKSIFDIWSEDFLNFVYQSEPHEINAQTQESQAFLNKMTWIRFKRLKLYTDAIKMRNWSYKEFLSILKDEIEDEGLNYEEIIEHLKEHFLIEFQNQTIQLKEIPSPDPWKLYNMNIDKFFQIMEKRIKEAGDKLIKNFARLYHKSLD
jgi:hypothetical protein